MKKNAKKLLLFMAVVVTAMVCFAFSSSAVTSGYYTYELRDGKAVITDVDTSISGNVTVPTKLGGCTVVGIGGSAFRDCISIKTVTIPAGIKTIESYAFSGCSSLTSVTIGSGVETIPYACFWNCYSLQMVKIGSNVKTIDGSAFESCKALTTIEWGKKLASIGRYAFYNCISLVEVDIPDTVLTIDYNAFYNCSGLIEVEIGKKVSSIGSSAFRGCTALRSIVIPDSVKFMGEYVFRDCSALTTVSLGSGLEAVPSYGFQYCKRLRSVTFGKNIKSIGYASFEDCISLGNFTLPSKLTTINGYAFCNCDGITALTLPTELTTIYYDAFYGCNNLAKITFNKKLTSIGNYAFRYCSALQNVAFPDTLSSLGEYAFANCSSLLTLDTGEGLVVVGSRAFMECTALKTAVIGNSVASINYAAFDGCSALENLTIGQSVASISGYAFSGCSALKQVAIPDTVTIIDYNAFYGCSSMNELSLGSGLITIGNYAFRYCSSLKAVIVPDKVTSIGEYAFSNCTSLKKISIPQYIQTVKYAAFNYCSELTHVYFGGDEIDWSYISIGSYNDYFHNAVRVYNHSHSYTQKNVPATLTANGSVDSVCKICEGTTKGIIPRIYTTSLSTTAYTYDGKVKTPSVTVKDINLRSLKKDKDYKITYEGGRKNTGRYTVRIDFIGKYSGTKRLYFTIAPKTPSGIKTSQTTSTITLSWNKVTGASGYAVFQYKSGAWKRIATLTSGDKISYKVQKLNSGTTYKFKIKAYKSDDGTIWGKATDTITTATKPATPKISSVSKSSNAVNIKWGKVTGASGYIVNQYISGEWKRIATINSGSTVNYRVEKLKSGTTYKFYVKAFKKVDGKVIWSGATSTISATTAPTTPSITKLTTTKGKAAVTWSNATGESGYELYFSTKKDSGFSKVASYGANVTSGSKSSLTSGKTYYFKVRAYKTVGDTKVYSGYSAVKSIKIK